MSNYFQLLLRTQLQELVSAASWIRANSKPASRHSGKKLVIIGCGAQGFNQGLNLRG